MIIDGFRAAAAGGIEVFGCHPDTGQTMTLTLGREDSLQLLEHLRRLADIEPQTEYAAVRAGAWFVISYAHVHDFFEELQTLLQATTTKGDAA